MQALGGWGQACQGCWTHAYSPISSSKSITVLDRDALPDGAESPFKKIARESVPNTTCYSSTDSGFPPNAPSVPKPVVIRA